MPTESLYEYVDGSANRYSLKGPTLSYVPVRPEESSTGSYSGGEPKTVILNESQTDSIHVLLDKASRNKSVHILVRVKGSGAIRIGEGKEKVEFILVQGCNEIRIIESTLKQYLDMK